MHEQNMAIVKSLVGVAWADGRFADEERELVEALIAAFEANEDEAKEIRTYAAEKKTLEDVPLTEELKAASWERAKQRARAGEKPDPAVMPEHAYS